MCRVYNTIGSLTAIKQHLARNNIHDFQSLKEVIDFKDSYQFYRQKIVFYHEGLVHQEKEMLQSELMYLQTTIETQVSLSEQKMTHAIGNLTKELIDLASYSPRGLIERLEILFAKWYYLGIITLKQHYFRTRLKMSIKKLVATQQAKESRFEFITKQFSDAVEQSAQPTLFELEQKKAILDDISNFIYGALGEHKVVKALESLSDEYFLINDFTVSFVPAIYNRGENDYIKSIQIDHILVAPSGVFLIETKNWSIESLQNPNLRSPVHQVKRASFVLYKLLNNKLVGCHLSLGTNRWGDKKISIRNLLMMISAKPREEFQFVKVLSVTELDYHIRALSPVYSFDETQKIADHLIKLNGREIVTKRRKFDPQALQIH